MFVSTDAATGRVIACNETLARKTGRPKENIIGKPMIELFRCRWRPDA
jgi:PAS domain-containing protein